MHDAAIWEQSDCFAASELHQHVIVWDEEHLLDLVQLLVAHDVQFAGAWRRLDNETKLFVVSLALGNKIGRHGHTLHVLNIPFAVIFFKNIELILFIVATIILVFILSFLLLLD